MSSATLEASERLRQFQAAQERLTRAHRELRAASDALFALTVQAAPLANCPPALAAQMGSIIEACAAAWQLTPEQLFAPTRRQPIATARQMAMALCMERTSATQWQVAAFCGKSQHGTVACAVRAVRAHCDTDRRFAATWAALNAALSAAA